MIETIKQWNITSSLPLQVGDFKLTVANQLVTKDNRDTEYLIFVYRNCINDWTIRAAVNPETNEFFVRTDIGMLEFAIIEFITEDFAAFRYMAEQRLPKLINDLYVERAAHLSVLIRQKGVAEADWTGFFPETYAGFSCIIRPDAPVRIINGSYMILAYYDAATRSGLSVMYNVLRDDFFAEQRIHDFPNLVHDFDSTELNDFRRALKAQLLPVLDRIAAELKAAG